MSGEKWSVERWREHVLLNSTSSFDLMVCAGALLVAEHPDRKPMEVIKGNLGGMSGFQAQAAMELAKMVPIEGLKQMEKDAEKEAFKQSFDSQVRV